MADRDNRIALIAAVAAAVIVATQVAGLAARSANFLDHYDAENLPLMIVGTAVVSIIAVLLSARAMGRMGPARLVPVLFFVSAALFVAERELIAIEPAAVAITLYLHATALGGILVSGFWALVTEQFDPRTAKKKMGRMMAGATIGTLVGGVVTGQMGQQISLETLLLVLAGANVVSGVVVSFIRNPSARHPTPEDDDVSSGLQLLRKQPYLRNLAWLILLGSIATGALDFLFNDYAERRYGAQPQDLLSFFAYFYAGLGFATFLIQTTLGRSVLQRFGLGFTLATLPATVALGSVAALLFPGLGTITGVRAGEASVRGSLFRSAYELLFSPASASEKRATKALIDVGCDGAGDALGGLLVLAVISLVPAPTAEQVLLGIAFGLSLVLLVVVNRLRKGYVQALEKSLRSRAAHLDIPMDTMADVGNRTAVIATMGTLPGASLMTSSVRLPAEPEPRQDSAPPATGAQADPLTERILALRSGKPIQVRSALQLGRVSAALIPHVIPLLGRTATASQATQALSPVAARHCGQLVDALLDPAVDLDTRRRLPRVIAAARNQRAVDGLLRALGDEHFDVRYRTARALATLVEKLPDLRPPQDVVFDLVAQEVSVTSEVWRSHDLSDDTDIEQGDPFDADQRQRSRHSLEHLFRLLALTLPREPLRAAFRGLTSDDKHMRGTALEFLEGALPKRIRAELWPLLED